MREPVAPEQAAAVLVGRDGGVKVRSDEPVPTPDLFARVDAMPMRRREMREKARR